MSRSVCRLVCLYFGKTVNWIRMLFGVVSGVSRGMGVLDGVVIVEREGQILGIGASQCNQWGLCRVVA